ncbi:CDP-glycerol glycerophosphotransferase family protein [Brevibacterium picturae]|uniref:CDP-glycerol glycerophosphotransferase family protein n=1 Tax=Brevibacterium picturae TaxID=260553 RepID=UPI0031F84E96
MRVYSDLGKVDRPLVTFSAVVIGVGAVLAWAGGSPGLWLGLILILDLAFLAVAVISYLRIRRNADAKSRVAEAVAEYAPEFYIYTARPDDASYQILMWLPYLARTGKKFAIITRNNPPARILAEQTDAPVIVCRKSSDLEKMLVPSLGAVFYVNASSGNGAMTRHQEYTHVYLGHGDSDKPPSYNPTHAMYDKIFAAGQAATERYAAHGVTIPGDKFEIVGRPQLEAVEVSTELPAPSVQQTVLYAPTWRGHVEETLLYSLPVAPEMIRELLRRRLRVIFRPHPFSYEFPEDVETIGIIHDLLTADKERTGTPHLFGAEAETDLGIIDCINLSDTMLSDVSSVVSDYLYSGKPFAMAAVSAVGDDFISEYPIARSAYVLNGDLSNLQETLDSLLTIDPKRQERLRYRSYYLGDFSAEGYADNFISAASRMASNVENSYIGETDGDLTGPDDTEADDANSATAPQEADSEEQSEDDDLSDTKSAKATLSLIYRKLGGRTLLPSGFASLVFVLTLVQAPATLTGVIGILASAAFLFVHRRRFKSRSRLAGILRGANAPRALLVMSLAAYWNTAYEPSWAVSAAAGVLVLTIVLETSLARAWRVTGLEARNLPGTDTRGFQPIGRGFVAVGTTLVTLIGWLLAVFGTVPVIVFVLSLLPFLLGVVLLSTGITRGLRSLRLDAQLPQILEDYGAEFAVYFGSNMGISYQLGMWLPYFDQIGTRYIVVTRNLKMMRTAGQMTEAPVIYRATLRSLEDVITPALSVAFYVNNAGKNTHFIERREMTHVWLNHGDSEKPACFNPVHAIYDYIYAAGQAGIDRYARHGVEIPRDKFAIVGRPQVEQIEPARGDIADIADRTVLYAPTWRGAYQDSELYSLPRGMEIVQALLNRGCTVIFRAHSLNYKYSVARNLISEVQELLAADAHKTGRAHIWGQVAEKDMALEECFNVSDAMISDVSAVVSDYLQSGKPLSIVSVGRTAAELEEEAPASKASYVIEEDLSNIDEALDALLGDDPLRPARDSMRKYYLGDFDAEHYAETFLKTARTMIAANQKS